VRKRRGRRADLPGGASTPCGGWSLASKADVDQTPKHPNLSRKVASRRPEMNRRCATASPEYRPCFRAQRASRQEYCCCATVYHSRKFLPKATISLGISAPSGVRMFDVDTTPLDKGAGLRSRPHSHTPPRRSISFGKHWIIPAAIAPHG
jgi:hypothetical protein